MSIDKQLELTGEKRNMSPGHQNFLKDRDGNDITDEVRRMKQQLIQNAQDQNQMAYLCKDFAVLSPSLERYASNQFVKVPVGKKSRRFEHRIPDNHYSKNSLEA
jgi:hypothetical protein